MVGPVLGRRDLLLAALAEVGFDPDRDRVISVGNLIDHGGQSAELLNDLDQRWFHAVSGCREERMRAWLCARLRARGRTKHVLGDGGDWAAELATEQQARVLTKLERLPVALHVETPIGRVVISHGETPLGFSWEPGAEDNAGLVLHETRYRIAAIHGRRRLMALSRAQRLGQEPPHTIRSVKRVALAVHALEHGASDVRIGNQHFLTRLSARRTAVFGLIALADLLSPRPDPAWRNLLGAYAA